MRTFLENRFTQLKDFFSKMERKDKIKLGILSLAVVLLAVATVVMLSRTNYETLYTAQTAAEAGTIYKALRDKGEPARVEGTRILVPEGKSSELLAILAEEGVLEFGGFNYDLLREAAGFNITDAHAKQLYEAQLGANIATQILTSDKVQSALVNVHLGEYSPFSVSSGVRDATASVMLVLKTGQTLTKPEAKTIGELVRTSVPGIKENNITISDSKFNYYAFGDAPEDLDSEMNSRIALQNRLSQQIQSQGEQLLVPIFGPDGVKVSVALSLNFDKRVTESVQFSPPVAGELDGIVRSKSELYEAQRAADDAEGVPGTDANAMGTVQYPNFTLQDGEQYRKAVMENNYEINEIREQINHEQGQIESLSVSVLLDENAVEDNYTTQVQNLVSKGLGVAAANVAVERVPFFDMSQIEAQLQAERDAADEQARRRELLQTIIMWAVILLLGLAFISLIKSIVKAARPAPPAEPLLAGDGYDGAGIDYYADDDLLDDAQPDEVVLNQKSTALEQIEKFIDTDAASVAQLLRNWLTDE